MHSTTSAPASKKRGFLGIPLSWWIIISMVVGVIIGIAFPQRPKGFDGADLAILSTVFLRLIKSVIIPLLFSTLVVGIAGHGDDLKKVGRLAVRSIVYFEIVTTLALIIGLAAVNIVKPGVGIALAAAPVDKTIATVPPTFAAILIHA